MKALQKFFKGLDYAEEWSLTLVLAVMVILNFANVCSRYVLHASISATDEVNIMLFVWISMLGSAAAYKRGAHLGMSFITDRLSLKGQAIMVVFSTVCSVVFLTILLKYGIKMVSYQISMDVRTPAMRMPACWQGLAIPVGAGFMIIRSLQAGIIEARRLWNEAKEGGDNK